MNQVHTFLMFEGQAREAVRFYVSLFADAEILAEEPSGRAAFRLGEQRFYCFDSPVKHQFGFTPAISIFVACGSEAEVDRLAGALGAEVLMPLGEYPFSKRYAWVVDQFGVSWQLSLSN